MTGVLPQVKHLGSTSSIGSNALPQTSQWSPLASAPQTGQIPSTYLSGKNFSQFSQ